MSIFDSILPEDSNTRGNVLDAVQALGMSLLQGNSRQPFGNVAQNLAAVQAGSKGGMSREAMKALLIQAGYTPELAEKYSATESTAKLALDQKKEEGFKTFIGGAFGGGSDAPVSNLGMGAPRMTPPAPGGPAAGAGLNGASSLAPPTGSAAEIQSKFVDNLKAGGLTNPYGLAAVAAHVQHESGFSPANFTRSWSDPSESGKAGTSGGALAWRNERLQAMQAATGGAKDPVAAQAQFTLNENPEVTAALQNAKSPEEANDIMARSQRFAGYNRPGGEYAARLATTRSYADRMAGANAQAPTQTADASGSVPLPSGAPIMPAGASGLNPKRPVQVADDENQTQVLEGKMGMYPRSVYGITPETQIAAADAPVSGAQEAAFEIPPGKGEATAPAAPATPAEANRTRAYAQQQLDQAARVIAASGAYGDRGKAIAEAMKLKIAPLTKYLEPTEIERSLDAAGVTGADRQAIIRNSIPDARPGDVKEYEYGQRDPGFRTYQKEMKEAGASKVSIDQKAEGAEAGIVGKARGEVLGEYISQGKPARQKVDVLNTMDAALDAGGKNIATGPMGESILKFKQGISQFTGQEVAGTTASEILKKSNSQLAAASAKALTSRPAQQEFINFTKNNPGLDISYEGNKFFINILKQEAQRESDISDMALAHKGSSAEFQPIKKAYEEAHPIINPFTNKPFGSSPDGPNGGGKGSTDAAKPGTEAPASMTLTDKANTIAQAKAWAQGKSPEQVQRVRDSLKQRYGIVTDAF